MNNAKYRTIFLEECADHLGELSAGLLALEKTPADTDALDLVFRMVHSIKGMAASLDYGGCADLSHKMEDRLGGYRSRGCIDDTDGLPLLFQGLSRLESMVEEVRAGGVPTPDPELEAAFSAPPAEPEEAAMVRPVEPDEAAMAPPVKPPRDGDPANLSRAEVAGAGAPSPKKA